MSTNVDTLPKKKSERILAFDLMRGYFLFVILIDHLGFYPNGFDFITGRGTLYVSTAEGFFVVSGLVLGIVRGRKLLNQPFKNAAKLLWKRAFQLYATSIILTLLFTAVGQLFLGNPGLKYGIFTDWSHWGTLLWRTFTLQYTYGWADFLRLYAIFIFFAPFALWIQDLSAKDPYYVLPIAMGAVMFMQQKLTMPDFGKDNPSMAMMKWMPVFMTVIFLNFPAGLTLYWFISNCISFAINLVLKKKLAKAF